ncbi:discoidin domain-containing protein [Frondihabitans sp. PAMC 28766]|uniref:discoidin domain-containing protein n=1 Tax=Frondihabitans sp. PAMC 28766 TaxID=1795630 RepID=UPI000A3E1B5A|nr:discoidin domain-containing protein [Frondihabitans sp. PAMC 28766]
MRPSRRTRSLAAIAIATAAVASLGIANSATGAPTTGSAASAAKSAQPSWAKYVVAPTSRDVKPVKVLTSTPGVANPKGALGGHGVTTLTRTKPATPPTWPSGTTAVGSSTAGSNTDNGVPRTYFAANAVDGDTTTFWNDATIGAYPDSLTLTSPTAVDLPGVTLLSNSDGVPQDYTVDALVAGSWSTVATVTGNTDLQHAVTFASPVTTTSIRITVTKDQSTGKGEYTRIAEVYPGIVPAAQVPSITLDFGKVVAGYPEIQFAGASAGHPGIRVATSETKQYLTEISDFTRSDNGDTITPGTDQIAVPTGKSTWKDTHGCTDGTKVCSDGLHGFRYLKISLDALASDAPDTQAFGTVKISGVSLDFTPYLGTVSSYKGNFESSDATLNQYWYDASYTNELITDTFRSDDVDPRGADSPTLDGKVVLTDGAKRDRDPYVGDIAVSGRTDYLTHADDAAASNVLADLADHQRSDGWIPPASINDYTLPLFDYPMYWVTASWDYELYSGDSAYGTKYYPNLVKLMNDWYPSVTDSNGLLSKGLNGTSGYGDYAFLGRTGEVTYYNALYVEALKVDGHGDRPCGPGDRLDEARRPRVEGDQRAPLGFRRGRLHRLGHRRRAARTGRQRLGSARRGRQPRAGVTRSRLPDQQHGDAVRQLLHGQRHARLGRDEPCLRVHVVSRDPGPVLDRPGRLGHRRNQAALRGHGEQ